MRRIQMLVAVAGVAAACATPVQQQPSDATGRDGRGQQLTAVIGEGLSTQSEFRGGGPHSDEHPTEPHMPSGTGQPADTVEAAASLAIIQLLEEEGLLVLGIESVVEPSPGPQTRIRTTVLFGTGRAHPREASYLVELEESTTTSWTVVSIESAP